MTTKKQNRRGQAGGQRGVEEQVKFSLDLYDSRNPADCQLSPDSLTRIAYILGDLGCFYLQKCQQFINLPDPEFNKPFGRACLCLNIEDQLLRRAAEAIEGGRE